VVAAYTQRYDGFVEAKIGEVRLIDGSIGGE
jgi:hypothetical protein